MDRSGINRRWRMLLGVVLLAGISACTTHYREGPPVYRSAYYHYPYYYHYYPSSSIYFHIDSGYYYYPERDRWVRVRELPRKYHLDRHDRVPLWIDTDKPYARNKAHREKYRSDPHYQPKPARDPEERRHNTRQHERYRKKRNQ